MYLDQKDYFTQNNITKSFRRKKNLFSESSFLKMLASKGGA